VVEERAGQGEDEAQTETPTAFDFAVNEFLAYLQGYRQPALSVYPERSRGAVERVLAVDSRGVPD